MMVKPGITRLDKYVDSRYTLVTTAAKRARMIGREQHDGEIDSDEQPVSIAVNEIADGKVGYVRSDEIRKARKWEREKYDAIAALNETIHEENQQYGSTEEDDTEVSDEKPETDE